MTWDQYIGLAAIVAAVIWGGLRIFHLLESLSRQALATSHLLDLAAQRLAKIEGYTHAIEEHTRRAVKEEYEQDDWDMRNPPGALRSFPKSESSERP